MYHAKEIANKALARTLKKPISYDPGSAILTSTGRKVLAQVAKTLKFYPWIDVVVQSMSPAQGAKGMELTSQRAKGAADYLRKEERCTNVFIERGSHSRTIGTAIFAAGASPHDMVPEGCTTTPPPELLPPPDEAEMLDHDIKNLDQKGYDRRRRAKTESIPSMSPEQIKKRGEKNKQDLEKSIAMAKEEEKEEVAGSPELKTLEQKEKITDLDMDNQEKEAEKAAEGPFEDSPDPETNQEVSTDEASKISTDQASKASTEQASTEQASTEQASTDESSMDQASTDEASEKGGAEAPSEIDVSEVLELVSVNELLLNGNTTDPEAEEKKEIEKANKETRAEAKIADEAEKIAPSQADEKTKEDAAEKVVSENEPAKGPNPVDEGELHTKYDFWPLRCQ